MEVVALVSAELDLLVEVCDLDGSAYAEARDVRRLDEDLAVRDGAVERAELMTSEGIGIRVRSGGGSGFAAPRDVPRAAAERALARALAIAEGAGRDDPCPPGP